MQSQISAEEFKVEDDFKIDMTQINRKDERFWDPPIDNQTYCLVSFVASQGATPDKNGVFGFMKVRGAYSRLQDAQERSEWLIREVDSYTPVMTTYMGKPFPLAIDNKNFVRQTSEVDIQNQLSKTVSDNIKSKKSEERKVKEGILDREKKLLKETQEGEEPEDKYTTLRVKKAQLAWTYLKTRGKMEEMKQNIIKARQEIQEMDETDENYAKNYYQRFVNARKEVGIPTDATNDDTFIKYLVESPDDELGF